MRPRRYGTSTVRLISYSRHRSNVDCWSKVYTQPLATSLGYGSLEFPIPGLLGLRRRKTFSTPGTSARRS